MLCLQCSALTREKTNSLLLLRPDSLLRVQTVILLLLSLGSWGCDVDAEAELFLMADQQYDPVRIPASMAILDRVPLRPGKSGDSQNHLVTP